MGQFVSRSDQGKGKAVEGFVIGTGGAVGERSFSSEKCRSIGKTKKLSTRTKTTTQSDESANAANRLKQTSSWSLGSLSGRLNWSFTDAPKSSFRNRNKSTRKSLTSLQQQQDQLRRSKTKWHKPLTNAIFKSHFKELSRNEEFYIDQLVARGAFGVVFKVIDKRAQDAQSNRIQEPTLAPPSTLSLSPSPPSESPLSPTKVTATQNTSPTSTIRTTETINTYALKVLKKSKIIQENGVQQIKDEADIQKICGHHPFIVQQIDLWQNRRNLHILSEFIPNGELFAKISHFSIDLIRLYLAEIALALDFLHNAGIIYRDAKPENILLTAHYHIKLIDFGLSKWLKLGATTKTICGTFQYMAPEILRGEPYGHAVDWWSLGVVVCQMVTNKSPDVRQFLQITLPTNMENGSLNLNVNVNSPSPPLSSNQCNAIGPNPTEDAHDFLPKECVFLPHESKDVLSRLLTVDPKKRIRSIMALQKIAMYKNFKIDSKRLLNLRPLDIIQRDNITLLNDRECIKSSSLLAAKAFHEF